MKFLLEIDCDNAAFLPPEKGDSPSMASPEVRRILKHSIELLGDKQTAAALYDTNGNRVGYFAFLQGTISYGHK